MKKLILLVLVFAFSITFLSCAKKMITTTEETQKHIEEGTIQTAEKKEEAGEKEVTTVESETIKDEEIKLSSAEMYQKEIQEIFVDIHFAYDKYDIREDDRTTLQQISAWLIKNATTQILIEGHCDERGTNEYNLALGDKRAKAAKDYLVSLGVESGRIEIISYGEERPACTEQSDSCWLGNRRAHFVTFKGEGS